MAPQPKRSTTGAATVSAVLPSSLASAHPPVRATPAQLRAIRRGITKHMEARIQAQVAHGKEDGEEYDSLEARRMERAQIRLIDTLMKQLEKAVTVQSATTVHVGAGSVSGPSLDELQTKYHQYENLVQAVAAKRRQHELRVQKEKNTANTIQHDSSG